MSDLRRGLTLRAEFLEQSRDVPRYRMQRWRPAERAGARTPDNLIEGEGIGISAHLRPRLFEGYVPEFNSRPHMP